MPAGRLRHVRRARHTLGVSTERVVVVGDAHFGVGDPADETAFRELLAALPEIATRLVLVGDLFDFWFEYPYVIPRRPFRTLAALAALVGRGVPVDLLGGNHDRWGGAFWPDEMGIAFHRETADLGCAGRRTHVVHGDGLSDFKLGAKVMHTLLRSRLVIRVFGLLPPAIGFGLADRLSDTLGESNRSGAVADRASAMQEAWARAFLDRRPDVDLVVLGHTHRRTLVEHAPGRFYLNAGQWMVDRHYAVVTPDRIDLLAWPQRPAV
jgi:UDP-2,3-diacylglucosamine hydrolase